MRIVVSGEGVGHENSDLLKDAWSQAIFFSGRTGSAGVVMAIEGYGLHLPHVGTSPSVLDNRIIASNAPAPRIEHSTAARPNSAVNSVLALSVAEQAREVHASLCLNKTQLAEVLGVTRPTLYDWLDGKEPNVSNAQRLTMVLRLLLSAGVTSASPLSPRFVRQSLNDGGTSLLEALSAESINEQLVSTLVREAKALGEEADSRRLARETRLRELGFEEQSEEQKREQLARNVALLDWPKK